MIKITNKLKEKYEIPYDQLRLMKASIHYLRFQGVECNRCTTKYNIPIFRNRKFWKCGLCNSINNVDFRYVLLPFNEPDLGDSRNKLSSYKANEEKHDLNIYYPCYTF